MKQRFGLDLALLLILTAALSGCSQMLESLRPDQNESPSYEAPTVGGRWSERGFLSESMPEGGAGDRGPASVGNAGGGDDWIDPTRADANRRELARDDENAANNADDPNAVSFSTVPNLAPPVRRLYKNGSRATRADFIDESPNEGSLWASDGQTNYYFTKNKVRGVGDIISINMEDEMPAYQETLAPLT